MNSNSQLYFKRTPITVNNVGVEIDTREYVFDSNSSISSHFNFLVGIRKDYKYLNAPTTGSLTAQKQNVYTPSNSAYQVSITSLYEHVRGYLYRNGLTAFDPIQRTNVNSWLGNDRYAVRVITIPLNELKEDKIKPGTFGMNISNSSPYTFNKYLEFNNSPSYNSGNGAGYMLLSDESWLCCKLSNTLDKIDSKTNADFTIEIVFSPKKLDGLIEPYQQFLLYRPRLVDRQNTALDSLMDNNSLSARMFEYTCTVSAIPSYYSYDEEINNKFTTLSQISKLDYDSSATSNNDCAMGIIFTHYPLTASITSNLSGKPLSGCSTFKIIRNGKLYGEYLALTSSNTAGVVFTGTTGSVNLFDSEWHHLVWTYKQPIDFIADSDLHRVYLDAVRLPNLNQNTDSRSQPYFGGSSQTTAWYKNNSLRASTVMTVGAKLQVIDQQLTTRNTVIQNALNTDIRFLYRQREFQGEYGLTIDYTSAQQNYGAEFDPSVTGSPLVTSATSDTMVYSFFGASNLEKYLSSYYGYHNSPEKNPDIYLEHSYIDAKKMICTDIIKDNGCFGFNGNIAGLWIYNYYIPGEYGFFSTPILEYQCVCWRSNSLTDLRPEIYTVFYGDWEIVNQRKFIEPNKRKWIGLNVPEKLLGNFCFWKDEKNAIVVNNRIQPITSAIYKQKSLKFNKDFGDAFNNYYGAGFLTKTGLQNPSINLVEKYEFTDSPVKVYTGSYLKHGKIIQNNPEGGKVAAAYSEVGIIFYDLGIIVFDSELILNHSKFIENISVPLTWSITGYDFSVTGFPPSACWFNVSKIKFETETDKYVNYFDAILEQDECNTTTNPTIGLLNNLTYPTSIGLYNDNDELLVVAKMVHQTPKTNYYGIRYKIKLIY